VIVTPNRPCLDVPALFGVSLTTQDTRISAKIQHASDKDKARLAKDLESLAAKYAGTKYGEMANFDATEVLAPSAKMRP